MSDNTFSLNRMSSNRAVLIFDTLPNLSYMLTGFPLPAIMLPPATQSSPFFDAPHVGDKLEFDDLEIEFNISEYLKEWLELFTWMNDVANPHEKNKISRLYDNATMILYTSHNNPFMRIKFEEIVPVTLGRIYFTESVNQTYELKSNAVFKYRVYTIEHIQGN